MANITRGDNQSRNEVSIRGEQEDSQNAQSGKGDDAARELMNKLLNPELSDQFISQELAERTLGTQRSELAQTVDLARSDVHTRVDGVTNQAAEHQNHLDNLGDIVTSKAFSDESKAYIEAMNQVAEEASAALASAEQALNQPDDIYVDLFTQEESTIQPRVEQPVVIKSAVEAAMDKLRKEEQEEAQAIHQAEIAARNEKLKDGWVDVFGQHENDAKNEAAVKAAETPSIRDINVIRAEGELRNLQDQRAQLGQEGFALRVGTPEQTAWQQKVNTLDSAIIDAQANVDAARKNQIPTTESAIPQPAEVPPQAAAPEATTEAPPQLAAEKNEAKAEQGKQYKEADPETAQVLTAVAKDVGRMWNLLNRELKINDKFDCSNARPLSLDTIGVALTKEIRSQFKPEKLAEIYVGGQVENGVNRVMKQVAQIESIPWDVAVGANASVKEKSEPAVKDEAKSENQAQATETVKENKDSSGELQMSVKEAQNALKEVQVFLDSLNKKLKGTGMGERMKPIIDQMRKYGTGTKGEFVGLQAYINRLGTDDDALANKGYVESLLKKMAHEMQADLQYLQNKGVFSERSFPQGGAGKILREALQGGQVPIETSIQNNDVNVQDEGQTEMFTPSEMRAGNQAQEETVDVVAPESSQPVGGREEEGIMTVTEEKDRVVIDENTEFVLPAHLHARVTEKFEGVNPDAITPQQVDEVYKAIDYPPGAPTEPFKTENIRQLVRAKVGKGKTEAKNAPYAEIKEQKAATLADIKNFINSENINSFIGAAEQQTVRKILELVKSLPFDQQTVFERDYNPNGVNPGREYAKLASVQKAVIEKVLDVLENRGADNALPEIEPIIDNDRTPAGQADNYNEGVRVNTESRGAEKLMSPEDVKNFKWYSSNTSVGKKSAPGGKTIYGLSLTTNPDYAQSYSKTKKIFEFDISRAKLKPVEFSYGMTITEEKHKQILGEGFDGLLFMGMGGPEVALLTDVAQLKQELSPIPKGIQALVDKRGSLPEKAVSDYNIKLPEGYVLENGRFVYKSTQVDSNAMSGTQADDYQYSVAA